MAAFKETFGCAGCDGGGTEAGILASWANSAAVEAEAEMELLAFLACSGRIENDCWFAQPNDAAALAAESLFFNPTEGELGRSWGFAYLNLPGKASKLVIMQVEEGLWISIGVIA